MLFHTGTHIIPISAYRTEGITAIWTTFDVDLYQHKPETSGSARKLCWIPISLFSTTTVDEICESLGELFAKPHSRFAVSLLSGHPRSIAALKNVLSEYLNIDFISFLRLGILISTPPANSVDRDRFLDQEVSRRDIVVFAVEKSLAQWNCGSVGIATFTEEDLYAILRVFALGRDDTASCQWSDPIHKESTITWEQLVSRSVLLNSPDSKDVKEAFIFHPILLKLLVSTIDSALSKLFSHVYYTLPSARTDWEYLEKFHIAFECLRHTLMAKRNESFKLDTYYAGQPFYGKKEVAKEYTFNPTTMTAIPLRIEGVS